LFEYWTLRSVEHRESVEKAASMCAIFLLDAIRRQLVSDVPVCTFRPVGLIQAPYPPSQQKNSRRMKGRLTPFP
jgi:hypothetical protein